MCTSYSVCKLHTCLHVHVYTMYTVKILWVYRFCFYTFAMYTGCILVYQTFAMHIAYSVYQEKRFITCMYRFTYMYLFIFIRRKTGLYYVCKLHINCDIYNVYRLHTCLSGKRTALPIMYCVGMANSVHVYVVEQVSVHVYRKKWSLIVTLYMYNVVLKRQLHA